MDFSYNDLLQIWLWLFLRYIHALRCELSNGVDCKDYYSDIGVKD